MEHPDDTDEERLWAMLAPLLTSLGYVVRVRDDIAPLVISRTRKNRSLFVAFHALQSLLFQLALSVAVAICLALAVTIVLACAALPASIVVAPVYIILAAIRAHSGELFEHRLVGCWARRTVRDSAWVTER